MKSDSKEEQQQELGKYREDIRGLVLAHIFAQKMEVIEERNALSGKFRRFYRKTTLLRFLLMFILFVLFFLHKPEWCAGRDDMAEDCTVDASGIKYTLLMTYFFPPGVEFILTVFCMLPLVITQYYKSKNIPDFKVEKTRLYLAILFMASFVIMRFAIVYNLIMRTDVENAMKMFFLLIFSNTVLETTERMFRLLRFVGFVVTLLGVCIFMFGLTFRIIFRNLEVISVQDKIVYPYSFVSLLASFDSLIEAMFIQNLPDIFPAFYKISFFAFILLLAFIFITGVVLISLLTGIFYNIYQGFYIAKYDEVHSKYPYFEKCIDKMMQQTFLDKDQLAIVIERVSEDQNYYQKAEKENKSRFLIKMKRAIKKIALLKKLNKLGAETTDGDYYFDFRERFAFRFLDVVLSFYTFILPSMIISNFMPESFLGNILSSELLGCIFLLDIYFLYKYTPSQDFFNFFNTIELVTNLGIIVFSNLCFLNRVNVTDDDFVGNYFFFWCWGLFCCMKIVRIHAQLLYFVNYKVIIKTLLDILPLILDLLIILTIFILIFAALSTTFYGGLIDSTYSSYVSEYLGNGDDAPKLSYNDIVISFVGLVGITIAGPLGHVNTTVIAFYHKYQSKVGVFFTKIFFLSFFTVITLIILNIVVGIVIDFLGVYLGNVTMQKNREDALVGSKDLFDILLDNEYIEDLDEREIRIRKKRLLENCLRISMLTDEEMEAERMAVIERIKAKFKAVEERKRARERARAEEDQEMIAE